MYLFCVCTHMVRSVYGGQRTTWIRVPSLLLSCGSGVLGVELQLCRKRPYEVISSVPKPHFFKACDTSGLQELDYVFSH